MWADLVHIPVFFVLGWTLRRTRVATADHGHFLLRLLFFVLLPTLVALAVADAPLTPDAVWLPSVHAVVAGGSGAAAWLWSRFRGHDRLTTGALIVCVMTLNNAFLYPYTLATWGRSGFVDHALMGFGNDVMISLVVYPLAFRFAGRDASLPDAVRRALSAPLLWALVLGVTLNLAGVTLPVVARSTLEPLGAMVSPVILIALGIVFVPRSDDRGTVAAAVVIRSVVGVAIVWAIVSVTGLEGETAEVALMSGAAPVGFMTLSIASLAGLRTELVGAIVSASLVVTILALPFWITLLTAI